MPKSDQVHVNVYGRTMMTPISLPLVNSKPWNQRNY